MLKPARNQLGKKTNMTANYVSKAVTFSVNSICYEDSTAIHASEFENI